MDFELTPYLQLCGGRDVWILGTDTRQHSQSVIRTWRRPSQSSLTRVLQSSHLCHLLKDNDDDEDEERDNMMMGSDQL